MRMTLQALSIALVILGTAGMASAQTTPATPETAVNGTVVSVADELLVIRTDDGQVRLNILSTTEWNRQQLNAGDRVRVWHRVDSVSGDTVAVRIERQDAANLTTTRESTPAARQNNPATARSMNRELPRTASSTPLLALLGALSLAGAVSLRFVGRSF